MADQNGRAKGRVVQVLGGVVDVEFPNEQLPDIYEAIDVPRDNQETLVLEVQKHLGDNWVRTVAMDSTDGLQRGRPAYATGAPIMVPVGEPTLGRSLTSSGILSTGRDQWKLNLTIRSTGLPPISPTNPRASKCLRRVSKCWT